MVQNMYMFTTQHYITAPNWNVKIIPFRTYCYLQKLFMTLKNKWCT